MTLSTTIKEGNLFLRVDEQDKVIQSLDRVKLEAKLSERFFYEYGDHVAAGAFSIQTLVYWRAAFRGFNLFKYSKHRLSTLFLCSASAVNAAVLHRTMLTDRLTDYFRPENPFYYGCRSLLCQVVGSAMILTVTTGIPFCVAQRSGVIPVPDRFYAKGNRQVAIKYAITKLKPYSKGMLLTTLAGCAFMFFVGMAEYHDTQILLAKINRKTTSYRES